MPKKPKSPFVEAREQVTRSSTVHLWFSRFATSTAQMVGQAYMFLLAVAVIVVWGLTGPYFDYSDTWQLIINTGTTIITFLVVFLIQNTQNRDAKALHLKLDELIRSKHGARNTLVDLENCTDEELAALEEEFKRVRAREKHRGPKHADDATRVSTRSPS